MKSRSLLPSTFVIFLFLASHSYSQVQTARPISISSSCGGFYEYLPQGYSTNTSQAYPLIVFIHGIGEQGNGTTDLGNILNCWTALPRLIANGGFPASFNIGGQNFSFIVISPQFNRWPYASDVNSVIDYAIKNYRVDQSRIYVTGLSMGGGAVWDFAGNFPTKAAAIVPICGAASADVTRSQAIANAKLPVWATHNLDDPTVPSYNTTGWVTMITQYGGDIQSTIFQASGHDAWTKTYDPNFTQNGVNIYQWMLQHQRGGSTPTPPQQNQPPASNAGTNQTITLPQNSVTLSGSGTDADGTIAFYEWTQVSGPSQASIVSAYSANTSINNLVQGSYVFGLKVTDDKGATAVSNVTITVNPVSPPPNQSPIANAGTNQTITLPQNSVTLSGSGTDADGTIAFYEWTQVSGPSQASIVSAYSANTSINNLVQGSYVFGLKVTDDKGATAVSNVTITVNPVSPPPNQSPIANAGTNQTITLPQNSVTLSGSGTDADGTIAFYEWTQVSGPSQASIVSAYSANTSINNLVQGSYVFGLKVTDDKGATAVSNVTITVNPVSPPPNQSPIANAGTNQTITLPQNSVTLSGSGTDADGTIAFYEWTQVSGPSQASIVSAYSANTSINNLVQGSYVFGLKVTDDKGATAVSNVTITVNPVSPPPNQSPIANAGTNQTITLPQNSVTLSGSGTDADGTIAFYEWTQVSGPSQASIVSAYSANTSINNLVQGSYVFGLKVTDDKGATAVSNVTITVNPVSPPPNQSPIANAGTNQTITLPQNSVTLSGSGTDADGTIAFYEWTQVSGPSQASIVSAYSANTSINNLVQGSYVFGLKVTDDKGATAVSNVTITVNPVPNQAPKANAGSDQTITLPANFVILFGSGFDTDGTISSYQWTQLSGPSKANIRSSFSAGTVADSLAQGIYTFRLTVTDNQGATAWDDMNITVNRPPNQVPVANAGSDQTITLPDNSVSLSGLASDADGTITSFSWTQTSGPTKSSFSSASPLAITVRSLVQGIYTFRLSVTDNDGATTWDEVKVVVIPDPRTQSTATIYPNPATDMIYVKIDALTLQSNSMITIRNTTGSIVYTENFVRTGFRLLKQIDVSKLPSGFYYLSVTTDIHTNATLAFIKQ